MDNTERIVILIEECKRMGIQVLPPDVNYSRAEFTVEEGHIRFGLGGVKNVGRAAIDTIVDARTEGGAFSDIYDFCSRVGFKSLNKRMIESLVMAGALDAFSENRAALTAAIDQAVEFAQASQRERDLGQFNLFGEANDSGSTSLTPPSLPTVPPLTRMERLAFEKSVLGFWFSGNPLEGYVDELRAFATPFNQLFMETDRAPVIVGGVVTTVTRRTIKKNDKPMMVIRIEDLEGAGEALLMNGAYEEFKDAVNVDSLILVEGTVSKKGNEDQPSVFVTKISSLEDARRARSKSVTIALSTAELDLPKLDAIVETCRAYPGNINLTIKLKTATSGTFRVKASRFKVSPAPEFIRELRNMLGRESVRLG